MLAPICSHSAARAVHDHCRNLADPEIEALEGLVVGVTVPPAPPAATVDDHSGGRRLSLAGGDPFAALTAEAPAAAAGP